MNPASNIPPGKCPLPFWIGGDLQSPTTVEIDHKGHVTLCPGISIGNTREQPLNAILQNYDCRLHPILYRIAEKGPVRLLELAKMKGYQHQQDFINECPLCYELRRFLQAYYPQYLAPESCYSDV